MRTDVIILLLMAAAGKRVHSVDTGETASEIAKRGEVFPSWVGRADQTGGFT